MKRSIIDRAIALNKQLWKNTVILEPRKDLDCCVLCYRRTKAGYHLVYGYSELVQAYMRQGMTEEDAVDYVEYNTIRALPYMASNYNVEPKIRHHRV